LHGIIIVVVADQEWLDTINVERKKEQLNSVTYETFEIVMDRLEKEWFDLVSLYR
jgi:NuA3 HAT complex component NTO1